MKNTKYKIFTVFLILTVLATGLLGIFDQANAMYWTQQTNSGSRSWTSVASSSDGSKLAATVYGGYVYTSTDGGVNWTERTTSGSRNWINIVSSSDGTKLVATTDGHSNYIYTSTDSGATWTEQTNLVVFNLYDVAMSSDGTNLIAASSGYGKFIYTSTDSGVTWVNRPNLTGNILDVAYSSDGTKAVATTYGGYINTSTDGGTNWTERTSAGIRNWMAVSMSSDGTKIIAAVQNGYIYTSDDSGATWIERTSAGSRLWYSVSMSNDGTKMIAGPANGAYPYISTDSGVTWSQETGAGSRDWSDVVVSGDGAKFAAVVSGYVYTGLIAVPSIATVGDTVTTATSVTLTGNITGTNGANATVRGFQYGLTTDYGTTTTENGSFSAGTYTADITSLTSCTTYHYRAYATNSAGSGYSTDNTFTTFCSPTVTTGTPKFLSSTSERLKGNITDTGGENATVRGFQYGPTTDYGTTTTDSGDHSAGAFSADVTGLTNGATYHYRAYATNSVGTSYGSDQSFVVGAISTISTCAEFEAINTDTNTLDGVYSLTADLDCTSEGNDIMVAVDEPFTGTFDGNGYTITVDIDSSSYSGLFVRANGATITDLNIAGSIVSSSGDIGSLIGYVYNGSDGDTHPILTITNVHSTATVTSDSGYVGGLIGEIYNYGSGDVGDTTAVNISNSSYTGTVTGTYYVGGLVGYIDQEEGASTSITNSYAVGDINGTDNEVGGLVGEWDQYDGDVVMTGNHYSGNITSTSSYVGGLVGYMYSDVGGGYEERTVTISDNYTTGSVSGSEDVGGMFGYSEFYIDQSFPLTVNIENNYSTADVTSGYGDAGGLFGYLYTYSYYTDYPLNITLSENYATGTITSTIENEYGDVGGLVGRLEINSDYISVVLSKSYFSGDIVTAGNYVGGLVGDLQNVGDTSMAINDSYASADITAYDGLGGLVGYVYANNGADLNVNRSYAIGTVNGSDVNNSGEGGGLIGVINGGLNITDSFSAALVQAFDYGYGAVVGYANNPFTTINVYFDQTTAGGIECADNDTIEGCTPVNTNETPNTTYFKSNHTNTPMDEWNFETIWTNIADENNNYPVLRAFHPVSTPTVTTSLATSTTQTTTTLNGEITATGGESNTVRGFEYGTTISYGSSVYDTGTYSTGTYSINLNGLVCGTTYYYRAYSTNSAGNGNGINDTFTTSNCSSGGGPVDLIVLQQMSDNLRNQTTPTNTQTNTNNTNTNTNNTNTKFIFTKNLKYKMKDNQVLELQKYLNNNGYPISLTGIGSLGNETNYFGKATQSALAKFQKANRIKPAIGYFGPVTRARVNK